MRLIDDWEGESADLMSRWDFCPNIREISIEGSIRHLVEVEAMFNSPKLFLKTIDIKCSYIHTHVDLKKVMGAFCSGGITTLESVEFRIIMPPLGTFNKLVEMNKSLRKVQICMSHSEMEDDAVIPERVVSLTKCFLASPNIKNLIVLHNEGREYIIPEVKELLGSE